MCMYTYLQILHIRDTGKLPWLWELCVYQNDKGVSMQGCVCIWYMHMQFCTSLRSSMHGKFSDICWKASVGRCKDVSVCMYACLQTFPIRDTGKLPWLWKLCVYQNDKGVLQGCVWMICVYALLSVSAHQYALKISRQIHKLLDSYIYIIWKSAYRYRYIQNKM